MVGSRYRAFSNLMPSVGIGVNRLMPLVPAHQHQLSHPLRPAQGEGHRAMAAHRVAQQMDFIDPQLIDHAFQNAGVEVEREPLLTIASLLPHPGQSRSSTR